MANICRGQARGRKAERGEIEKGREREREREREGEGERDADVRNVRRRRRRVDLMAGMAGRGRARKRMDDYTWINVAGFRENTSKGSYFKHFACR